MATTYIFSIHVRWPLSSHTYLSSSVDGVTVCANQYSVINHCSLVSHFLLCNYSSLCRLNLSSLSLPLSVLTSQCNKQYLKKYSILCRSSSVAWLTTAVQTIFGESVIFAVNPPWYDQWQEAIWQIQCIATRINSLFFVVYGPVSLTLFCGIFKNVILVCYLSCMVDRTDFSLVCGSLRLTPII